MGLFEQLPYTNFHELNLTEMIRMINELAKEMHEFKVINKISYGGDWDITKQYPAWTVVCVGGTEGYISIQPVPNGVDYTNTDYWRLVADFTVQLADLGNRVATIENELITVNSDIDNLETVTTWLRGMLTNATKKVICISDSYGLTPTVDTSWIAHFKNLYGISNDNFYRSQGNGAGFIGFYPNLTFQNQLTDLAGTMTSAEKNAINEIIIGGGYNDADVLKQGLTTVNNIMDAVRNCITYARNTFPNAKIYIVWLGWSNVDFAIHNYIRGVMNIYYQVATKTTKNVIVIDGINWLHRIALADGSGYHPNAVCAEAMAMSLVSKMNGGDDFCDLAPNETSGYINITVSRDTSTVTTLNTNAFRQTYRNGTVFTRWTEIKFTNINEIQNGNELKLGDITDGCLVGGSGTFAGAVMPCMYYTSWNNFKNGNLLIHDGGVYFAPNSGNVTANSNVTIMYGYGSTDVML